MFSEDFNKLVIAAKAKVNLLENNPLGFFVSSMLAGIFVGVGIILSFMSSASVAGMPYQRLVLGVTFGIALSLVIMAGSELFTGNNLVMTAGNFSKEVKWSKTLKLWIVCYIGNWVGSILIAVIFTYSGLAKGPVSDLFNTVSAAKVSIPFSELILRAIFCNMLVCLAVWCSFKLKSEAAKLIMISWCLLAFIVIGLEHSIANMTVLSVGILSPDSTIELGGYFYNILVATLGNIIGGVVLVSLPYFIISKNKS